MYALYRIITNDFSSVLIFSPPVLCHLSVCYGKVLRILIRGMQCGRQCWHLMSWKSLPLHKLVIRSVITCCWMDV